MSSRPWVSLGDALFPAFRHMGNPIAISWVCSKRMALGSSIGPFTGIWLYLWFPKGYSPLLLMPTWGPQTSVQRLTPWAATAVTIGAGYPLPPTQPLNVAFQYVGSLQCPSVSLPGFSEGLIMQVFPPPWPRLGFPGASSLGVVG